MTMLKICGLRDAQNAVVAAGAGADFLGFNFVPGVRRQISVEHAKGVIREYRQMLQDPVESGSRRNPADSGPLLVGLFANQPLGEVNRIVEECGLDLAQLCGDEPPEYWEQVNARVIKQVRVRDEGPRSQAVDDALRRVEEIEARGRLPLLDKHEAGLLGGTGRTFDWSIAAEIASRFDVLLAGGLTPENVGHGISVVTPWGVDVSSGVETNGEKDPRKIAAFAQAVGRAGAVERVSNPPPRHAT